MTFSTLDFSRARNYLLLGATLTSLASIASAQQSLTYLSYASAINIDVPTAAASATCTALPKGTPTTQLYIRRTFEEKFDALDLKTNRWTPHYDGGYDEVNKVWLGYDWITKRTQPGMHEQQLYVDPAYKGTTKTSLGLNPFIIEDGYLHILAQKTPEHLKKALSNFEYTSGVLTTRKSFIQRYGYFESRIKVPATQALLPAFWLLPFNKSWPPELDVMEAPTHQKDVIQSTVHWLDAAGKHAESGCKTIYPNFSADFHQYGALWTADKIVYYIDRVPVGQIKTPPGMNVPMYMQINLAVGGDWIGKATAATPIPAEMVVDNVVAYSVEGPNSCATLANGVLQCPAK